MASVKRLLKQVTVEGKIEDPEFTEDLYALMRLEGSGLPDDNRMKAMADKMFKSDPHKGKGRSVPGFYMIIKKRQMLLNQFVKMPYFQALAHQPDLIDSVGRLLRTFNEMYKKVRQSQCQSCQLKPQCAFGQQYGAYMTDISMVIDPDFDKKIDPNCPSYPEVSSLNQMNTAANAFANLLGAVDARSIADQMAGASAAEIADFEKFVADLEVGYDNSEDPVDEEQDYQPTMAGAGGAGKGINFNASFNANHICQTVETFVGKLTQQQLAVYDLGLKFTLALQGKGVKKFTPVKHIDKDKSVENIKSLSEVSKVSASQQAMPEELFDARLAKKQLHKVKHLKPDKDKKKLLYFLIDASGSMKGQLGPNGQHGLFTRGALCSTMSLAMTRKVEKDDGIVFCRFFGGSVGRLFIAHDKESYNDLCKMIADCDYNADSTSIDSALRAAVSDIETACSTFPIAESEVLMITDCEDSLALTSMKEIVKKHEINILDVAGSHKGTHATLKAVANKYYKANESTPDVSKLVTLL